MEIASWCTGTHNLPTTHPLLVQFISWMLFFFSGSFRRSFTGSSLDDRPDWSRQRLQLREQGGSSEQQLSQFLKTPAWRPLAGPTSTNLLQSTKQTGLSCFYAHELNLDGHDSGLRWAASFRILIIQIWAKKTTVTVNQKVNI